MSPSLRAQLQVHFCVLLWGFTAIIGKAITLPAVALVWWRMLIVSATLLLVPRVWRAARTLPRRMFAIYAGVGVLVALHWLTFYGAIKLANASVAVICIALAPVLLAIVEPWIAGRHRDPREMLIGAAVIPGVALVVGGIPTTMHAGLAVGVLSALFVALFSALNKRYVERADPLLVTTIELGTGALFLTMLMPFAHDGTSAFVLPSARDATLLLLLAFACTLLPFTLSLVALRRLSAFAAQLIVNVEPIYAIVLAALLFGEQRQLDAMFYPGVAIILGAVFAHPWLTRQRRRPQPETLAVAETHTTAD
jgi:drug/metabolite transporter (DMT)-like permease